MALTGKWTASSFKYIDKSGNSIVEDESGNGNHARGFNVTPVYLHDSRGKPLGNKENETEQAIDTAAYSVGTRESFEQRKWEVDDETIGLGFNGHSFMKILNDDAINLSKFTLCVSVGLYNPSKSQYIIDKRNGQWYRNYCMLYASPSFPHLRDGMNDSSWFLVDIGDGSWMDDDFHNGVFFSIDRVPSLTMFDFVATFDGNFLVFWLEDKVVGFREKLKIGDITGSGDLVVGDAGFPHTVGQWPVGNSHTLYGKIDKIEIYDTVERVVTQESLMMEDSITIEPFKKPKDREN
ncbi:MAG: hypothetical protein FVQ80_06720 [Planctomycetes bacterium]|nr:hypothetical protein [Planctomycetota bacterium]